MADTLISSDLAAVLSSLTYEAHDGYFTAEPAGQLSPALYSQFKKVLATVGGQWMKGPKEHRFAADPQPLIAALLAAGRLPDLNPLDFYPTPAALVAEILDADWVQTSLNHVRFNREAGKPLRVLEPSCGTGTFATALADRLGSNDAVLCVEKNPVNVAAVRSKGFQVEEADFLQWTTDERFDLIVMNPPFDGRTWRKHLEHAMQFLAPLGRLVCIAPTSVRSASSAGDIAFLRRLLRWGSIEDNADRAFASSGTNVNTVTIFFENEPPVRREHCNYPSYDAFLFDVNISSDARYHAQFRAGMAKILDGIRNEPLSARRAAIAASYRPAFVRLCEDLNHTLLTKEGVGCELAAEDLDFLLRSELADAEIELSAPAAVPLTRGPAAQIELQLVA